MAIDTVPVRIEPAAAQRIEELGFHSQIMKVIELAKSMAADLQSVEVSTWTDFEEGTGTYIHLIAWKDYQPGIRDQVEPTWQRQIIETFPPDFRRWVICSMYPREAATNGR